MKVDCLLDLPVDGAKNKPIQTNNANVKIHLTSNYAHRLTDKFKNAQCDFF